MPKTLGSWDLTKLLAHVHEDVQAQLDAARQTIGHPTDKGDASESVWIDLFNTYLPRRYHAVKGHVVDSKGSFSEQIDVIIHDRQYTPLIFSFKSVVVMPAESVYAVFESKQEMNAGYISAAKQKLASVRRLHRTSGPVVTQGQETDRSEVKEILGGILALDCPWVDTFGEPCLTHLADADNDRLLSIGCVASKGMFLREDNQIRPFTDGKHATRFLFKLMTALQQVGTVPAIEMNMYELFLSPDTTTP